MNTTAENNKKIAEFMKLPTEVFKSGILNYGFNEAWYELEELSFNSSWDWLMEVVEKIESVFDSSISVKIEANYCSISTSSQYAMAFPERDCELDEVGQTKIQAVYKAVIGFIDWYNKQNSPEITEDKEKALEWWNKLSDKEKLEKSLKHYNILDLNVKQIIIVWRRITGGEFNEIENKD